MTVLKKCFVWYRKLTKLLLHQWSIVVLLCLVPAVIPLTNLTVSQDSGVLHIVVYSDGTADRITDSLITQDSIIHFSKADSPENAKKAVAQHKADAAWIFTDDFLKKLDSFASGKENEPIIEIVEREPSIPLNISKEKLFSSIYRDYSFSIYKNFVYTKISDSLTDEKLYEQYISYGSGESVIDVYQIDGKAPDTQNINYLNAPIRGLLALVTLLCALTSAMYFLKDQQDGKFDWMPIKRRLPIAFAYCLSACVLASAAMLGSILISDISKGFWAEIISIIPFALQSSLFCTVFCLIFRSPGKLGAMLPGFMIIIMALSPIFFNLKVLRPIRLMLPTHYYLYSIQNSDYYLYSVLYCILAGIVIAVINALLPSRTGRTAI